MRSRVCHGGGAFQPNISQRSDAATISLPGSVSSNPISCTGTGVNGLHNMNTCYTGTMTCPNAKDIDFNFGYLNSAGAPNGTIVLLPGSGGTNANNYDEATLAQDYASSSYNYQVVQLQRAGNAQWEDVNQGNPSSANCPSSSPCTPNILAASARPASFLAYVFNNYVLPIRTRTQNPAPRAGMCVEGFSAGSAATTYTLADWGGDKYLDKVELLSGPVLNDIQAGCVPQNTPVLVPICYGTPTPPFCKLGSQNYSQAPWSVSPNYIEENLNSVQKWTDTSSCTCGGSSNGVSCDTGGGGNIGWANMSVLNPNSITSYPNTVVTGFICATTTDGTQNNSAPLGWTFFDNLVSAKNLNLYAVQNCVKSEGVFAPSMPPVPGASVPAIIDPTTNMPEAGMKAVEMDMASSQSPTGVCQNNH